MGRCGGLAVVPEGDCRQPRCCSHRLHFGRALLVYASLCPSHDDGACVSGVGDHARVPNVPEPAIGGAVELRVGVADLGVHVDGQGRDRSSAGDGVHGVHCGVLVGDGGGVVVVDV